MMNPQIHAKAAYFVGNATEHLSSVLDRSGGILYSSVETLCPGDIYILGLNPGGESGWTIAKHLEALPSKQHNSYLDEAWENRTMAYGPGESPLQKRLHWLIDSLGYDLRRVCASNLIFMRSRDATGVAYPEDADLCWPVHEEIIGIVRPKIVLAFGNSVISPYDYLRRRFAHDEEILPSGHGAWACKGFWAETDAYRFYVAGLPHLSRYSPIGKNAIVGWLKSKVS